MGVVHNLILGGGGTSLPTTLNVTVSGGTATTVTASLGSRSVSLAYDSTSALWSATLPKNATGNWTVTATDGSKTVSDLVAISGPGIWSMELMLGNVPSGYTEIEYLQNDGTAYLSLPLHDVETHRMVGTASIISFDGAYGFFFGVAVGTGSGASGTSRGEMLNFATYGLDMRTTQKPGAINASSFRASANTKYSFDISFIPQGTNPPRAAIINGVSYPLSFAWTGTATLADTTNLDKLLFAQKEVDTIYICTSRIYGNTKFYSADSDDAPLSMDLYPARRNSDSVLGMWDNVTQTFYTNAAGSGSFVAGPDV